MRLHKQEKAAQRAAQASGKPVSITWLYDQLPVRVRAKKKLVGYDMRYWLGEHKYTRRQLVEALWNYGVDGPDV